MQKRPIWVSKHEWREEHALVTRVITREPIHAISLQGDPRILTPDGFDQVNIMRLETAGWEVSLVTCYCS